MKNKKILAMMDKRNELKTQARSLLDAAERAERPLTNAERETLERLKVKIGLWDDTIKETVTFLDDAALDDAQRVENSLKFPSFGEQLHAVYNAAKPERSAMDARLFNGAGGASESVPSDGGFLVQTDFAAGLLQKTYETGILAARCKKIPLSSGANGVKINALDDDSRDNGARWGGIQAFWTGEADELAASKPKFRQMKLFLKKLAGLCYTTDELLSDTTALESVIAQGFAEEFGFKMDDVILNGTGIDQPLGILRSNGLVTVAKETDQTDIITALNLTKMWARCWGRSRNNAVWYINQELEPYLYTLKIGDIPVYIPAGGLSSTPYGTIFGRPVIPIEQCSAVGEKGDIILADLSQYLLVDKGGMNAASSIHVRFLYDENVFRFTYHVDGQPIWNAPIIPYKGAGTLSPFVTLSAR